MDINIYGTLTGPADEDLHSAVVFVAGSGPTDRDWCSPLLPGMNGTARLLAEALAKKGYVTLRYDKMGSGPHVKENMPKFIGKASMQSHVKELATAVEALLATGRVAPKNLYVLTNSEGAIHALNYQRWTNGTHFDGLMLTAPPGRSVGDLARSQIQAQVQPIPNAENIMKAYDAAVAEFVAGKPMTIDAALPDPLKMVLKSLETPANLPFSRELWTYRLADYLSEIDAPTLVLIGKKDIQVDWKIDGALLEKAATDKTNFSFVYPENANHVFKHEIKPRGEINAQWATISYNAADAVLDTEVLDAILGWLKR